MLSACKTCSYIRNTQLLQTCRTTVKCKADRHASAHRVSPAEYCMDIVRKYDYENFLCTLLLPKEARSSVFAVRAFNVELAQIRDVVSDPKIGEMRIQFWKDTLDLVYKDNPPQTPVAVELAKAIHRHKLTKQWLTRIIDSRIMAWRLLGDKSLSEPMMRDILSDRSFYNLKQAEDYMESSVSSVYYLTLQALGITDVNADHAISHLGRSQGLVTMLRAVPFNAQQSRCYLPTELLMLHNVSQEDIIRGCREQRMKDLVFDIAGNANVHLETARKMKSTVPKKAYKAFLPAVSCGHYLRNLQQADFDVFHSNLQQRNHWLPLSLWWTKTKRTY